MTEKKLKKVYIPPVAEELAMDAEIKLLGNSTRMQHLDNSSTPAQTKDGMEISSVDAYEKESW